MSVTAVSDTTSVPRPAPVPGAGERPRPVPPDAEVEAAQVLAEQHLARDGLVGALVGMVVCAGLWALLVFVALVGTDWPLGPAVWMGAGVGLFGGSFLGGWVGVMAALSELEDVEHRGLPRA